MRGSRSSSPQLSREPHGVRFVSKAGAGTGCACRSSQGSSGRGRDRRRQRLEAAIRPRKSSNCWNSNLARMIRQLERAANSVAGGAEATAATLSTIRQRTDALTGRTSAAQGTATTFSQAADKFTQSAQGIGIAGARRRQARRPGQRRRPRSQRQCRSLAGILGGDRQCRQPDRADRAADHAARAQLHHRGRARRRGRPRLCGRRHRGQGAGGADPERDRRDHQEDRGAAAATPRARSTPCIASRRRSRRSARCSRTSTARSPSRTRPPAKCPTMPPPPRSFIVSVGDSAAEIDSATKEAEAHGESVAKRRQGRHRCLRRSSSRAAPCCCGREQKATPERRKDERLPCSLKIEIADPRGRDRRHRSTRFPWRAF